MPRPQEQLKKPTKPGGSSTPAASSSSLASSEASEKRKDMPEEEYIRRKHKFIKSSIRFDYQPDICKDYKETGFCGFGDSCKFLHDRSDYKSGWQLDQEWSKGQYQEESDDKYLINDGDEDDEDEFPRTCPVCNDTYKEPIETKCKHYFCGNCADKECIDKCFVCNQSTSGIFRNAAKIIKEKLKGS